MPVCIAGMHRSGTSMVARLLNESGVYLGGADEMMKPGPDNPEGFFENLRFSQLNDELLNHLGGGWDYLPPNLFDGWQALPALDELRGAAAALAAEFAPREPWGWKDPRNSLTIPFWKALLPGVKVVICLRNPLEVAASLQRRGSASLNFSLNLWLMYNTALLRGLQPADFIVTRYDRYFTNPHAELKRVLRFLDIPFEDADITRACGGISSSLQHHRMGVDDLRFSGSVYQDEALRLYEAMLGMSDLPALDVQQGGNAPLAMPFTTAPAESPQAPARALQLQADLAERNRMTAELHRNVRELQTENESLRRTVHELRASSSWRITAPWRAAGALAQRIRRKAGMLASRVPLPGRIRTRLHRLIMARNPLPETVEWMRRFDEKHAAISKLTEADYAAALKAAFPGPPTPVPVVTIIIPVHNQLRHTVECLLSIADLPDKTPYEIIVADDLSDDGTADVLSACGGVRHLRHAERLGFLRSCNRAAAEARGEYLLLLNNDTHVLPGWLDALKAVFDEFPRAGLAGSKLLNADKTLQEAGGILWEDGTGWNFGRGDDPDKPQYNYLREADYCSGASIMVPKAVWREMGGFDETFAPAYYEDTDLAFRLRQAGYGVLYQPRSQVVHFEGVSSGRDVTRGVKRHQEVNRAAFVERWRDVLALHGSDRLGAQAARRHARGRILFMDAVTPTPDQDSGSIDAFNFMRMFRRMGFEVSFLPVTNLLHIPTYTTQLQAAGVECQYFPFVPSVKDYLRQEGAGFDLVILSRFPVADQYLEMVRRMAPRAKVVFNTVDLHFLREGRQLDVTGSTREDVRRMEAREFELMRLADRTVVVSAAEEELIKARDASIPVRVIPIPRHMPGRRNGFEARRNIAFLGGYQHTPNVDAVHYFMREIWPLAAPRLPGVKFIIAGSKMPAAFEQYWGADVTLRGFVEDLDEFFETHRLTVAPLRFGAGVKGKVVSSLSYGVPCVATPLAVEGMGLGQGEGVLVGGTPQEFADQLVRLYTSPDTWNELSERGLRAVKRQYSLPVVEEKLAALLDELLRPAAG